MYNVPLLAKGFFVLVIFYVTMSITGIISLYRSKETWGHDFQESMKNFSFRALLFFYLPIGMTKKMMS